MAYADVYVEGFKAYKKGLPKHCNPYPVNQLPEHRIWWAGWNRSDMTDRVGNENADKARADYVAIHGEEG